MKQKKNSRFTRLFRLVSQSREWELNIPEVSTLTATGLVFAKAPLNAHTVTTCAYGDSVVIVVVFVDAAHAECPSSATHVSCPEIQFLLLLMMLLVSTADAEVVCGVVLLLLLLLGLQSLLLLVFLLPLLLQLMLLLQRWLQLERWLLFKQRKLLKPQMILLHL